MTRKRVCPRYSSVGFSALTSSASLTYIAVASELKRLYKLYSHLPTGLLPADDTKYGMTAVSKMVKDHIESVGNDLVKGQIGRTDGGDEFINQLIALHTKYATLVEECFQDHALFQKALKEVRHHSNS